MITSIGIYLAIICLACYFIWFLFINRCELESSLIKTLAGDSTYPIDDTMDLVISIITHLLAIPLLIFTALVFLWPIVIIGTIILLIYRKKYNL